MSRNDNQRTISIALCLVFLLSSFVIKIIASAQEQQLSSSSSPTTSLQSSLASYALPLGLFPKGISNFSLDPATGSFNLQLISPKPCDAKFETRLRYDRNITGRFSYGKVANLSGLAAQELFLWLAVKGIQVDVPSSGLIYFDVGVLSKQFSLSFFETPKDCNVVVEDGDERIYDIVMVGENQFGKVVRKEIMDEEGRADS